VVSIENKATARTSELSLGEGQMLAMPTPRAILSSIAGIDSDVFSTGARSLIEKKRCKLSPSHIRDALSEAMIVPHLIDIQILNGNDTEAIDDAPAILMGKVCPSVRYAFVDMSNHLSSFSSGWSSLRFLRQFALRFSQCLLISSKEARIRKSLTSGKGSEVNQTNINSYSLTRLWEKLVFHFTSKAHKPLSCACVPNTAGFDFAFNRAMNDSFHCANFRQSDFVGIDGISTLWIGKAVIPASSTKSRVAWLLSGFYSSKESLKSKVNPHSHILQYLTMNSRKRWSLFFQCREHIDLVIHTKRLLPFLPNCFPLLKKMIVEPSALIQSILHSCSLACRRIESIAKGYFMHEYSVAYFRKGIKRAFIPPLKGWVFPPAIL